ncbi:glycosyltransferase family 2 protein [Sulfitobacter aestuarii]|uniref:Glycosyltransferase family 2 protein n=1 Tax=Sulfitobacter aestuarii TaxID=2161676 RepID=A0ABW5U319_9RHOB
MSATQSKPTRIDVLLCTFRRPSVTQTLMSLDAQVQPDGVEMRVIVADNDDWPSARETVEAAAAKMRVPVLYHHAPARNISIARNAGLATADADWIAFIDDDETASPDWLATLLARAVASGADGVFGPALARYAPQAPAWMRQQDVHSNIPEQRRGAVQTGHTCNAMLAWRGKPWRDERFDLARGQTGGEDTEFFFRIARLGARFVIAEDAIVTEDVTPGRLKLSWLLLRKYRMGQSYAAAAPAPLARLALALSALGKLLICAVATVAFCWSESRRMFWLLRGALHLGVVSGCLALAQPKLYGR